MHSHMHSDARLENHPERCAQDQNKDSQSNELHGVFFNR